MLESDYWAVFRFVRPKVRVSAEVAIRISAADHCREMDTPARNCLGFDPRTSLFHSCAFLLTLPSESWSELTHDAFAC